jgi:23S rRNA (pseudouridine1915-N3)-methyltransferase
MKIFLYYIGKPRDANANAMAEEYIKRTVRYARCEMREIHPARFDLWAKHPSATKILLDAEGKRFDSFQFAGFMSKAEQEARDLVFAIGGASGYPAGWREKSGMLLSLSAMTFPHEFARVMVAEQIYRAFTILRGHPYPK